MIIRERKQIINQELSQTTPKIQATETMPSGIEVIPRVDKYEKAQKLSPEELKKIAYARYKTELQTQLINIRNLINNYKASSKTQNQILQNLLLKFNVGKPVFLEEAKEEKQQNIEEFSFLQLSDKQSVIARYNAVFNPKTTKAMAAVFESIPSSLDYEFSLRTSITGIKTIVKTNKLQADSERKFKDYNDLQSNFNYLINQLEKREVPDRIRSSNNILNIKYYRISQLESFGENTLTDETYDVVDLTEIKQDPEIKKLIEEITQENNILININANQRAQKAKKENLKMFNDFAPAKSIRELCGIGQLKNLNFMEDNFIMPFKNKMIAIVNDINLSPAEKMALILKLLEEMKFKINFFLGETEDFKTKLVKGLTEIGEDKLLKDQIKNIENLQKKISKTLINEVAFGLQTGAVNQLLSDVFLNTDFKLNKEQKTNFEQIKKLENTKDLIGLFNSVYKGESKLSLSNPLLLNIILDFKSPDSKKTLKLKEKEKFEVEVQEKKKTILDTPEGEEMPNIMKLATSTYPSEDFSIETFRCLREVYDSIFDNNQTFTSMEDLDSLSERRNKRKASMYSDLGFVPFCSASSPLQQEKLEEFLCSDKFANKDLLDKNAITIFRDGKEERIKVDVALLSKILFLFNKYRLAKEDEERKKQQE